MRLEWGQGGTGVGLGRDWSGARAGLEWGFHLCCNSLNFPSCGCRMGCMKSKETAVQEKVIKTDPDPNLPQGHYVRDPTATSSRVSGSCQVSWGPGPWRG